MTITIKPKSEKELIKIKKILDAVEIDLIENDQLWEEISDAEKESVKSGLEDADKGNLKPHFEARKLYEKWL